MAMPSKEKFKKNGDSNCIRRTRKSMGVTASVESKTAAIPLEIEMSNGKEAKRSGAKRNPAKLREESKEVQKANELMLRAWERIYAKRGKFGKLA
jgi:hypothetical protein